MKWKVEKDGLTLIYSKGNLKVVRYQYLWDRRGNRYDVVRSEGDTERVVEKGFTARLDIKKLLPYVERNWAE